MRLGLPWWQLAWHWYQQTVVGWETLMGRNYIQSTWVIDHILENWGDLTYILKPSFALAFLHTNMENEMYISHSDRCVQFYTGIYNTNGHYEVKSKYDYSLEQFSLVYVIEKQLDNRSLFYWHGLILIPSLISNMPIKLWDEITYPFPNFNGATVEVWEWISTVMLHFIMDLITCPCMD